MSIDAAALRVTVSADSAPAERGLKSFSNKLSSAGKNMTIAGGIMSAAITAPLIGIATNALSMAADFEQSMDILQQVTGASTDTMAAMNAQALALGASTVFSAGEAANAMLELGKAGMGTSDIMASIPGVMSLAAAGGMDLANAANLTANALNAFHLDASEAGRVADLLAAGANASSASMTDLGQGLQAAGFAFASANQPIENLVASLAILTNVGLTGSDAGTALKNAFMRMMNPTQEAADLIKALGISFYDASGTMKALPDIIDMLNAALGGMTDQQRDATLSTLFMSDGMKAMIPLLDQGSTGFNKMVGEVTKVGAASDVAGARMKGLSGGLEYLSGSVDSFLIGAAQPFLGVLNSVVVGIADAITSFGALSPTVILATEAFVGILAAIGPVLLILGGLAEALASPLLPIALLIVGVAALGAAWAANLGGIQDVTAAAFAPVQEWFSSTLAGAQTLATGIATAFSNTKFPSIEALWNDFKAGDFDTIASKITSTAYTLMVNLDAELNITGKANELKAQLVGAVNSLGTAISNLDFSGATANAGKMRDGILSGISSAIDSVDWAGGGATFAGLITGLTSAVSSLDFSGIDWATLLQSALVAPVGAAIAAINWVIGSDSFAGLETSVQTAISEVPWADISVSTSGLEAAIGGRISAAFSSITSGVSGQLGKIDIDWGALAIDTVGLVNALTASINSINWGDLGANVANGIMGAIAGAVQIGVNFAAIKDQVVASTVGLAANIGLEIGKALAGVNVVGSLEGLATSINEAATAFAGRFIGAIALQGMAIGDAFGAVIANALGQVQTSLGTFTFDLPKLSWDVFVTTIAWINFIPVLAWDSFVAAISWSTYIFSLGWETFITALGWSSFVPSIDWTAFVPGINWSVFVPQINWGAFVDSIGWGDFIPSVNWRDFIPFFGGGGGGSGGPGQDVLPGIPAGANGFSNFRGGMALVGERGPELVDLPRGSNVYSHRDSMQMAGDGGTTINIYANVASDIDIESMAQKIARVIARKQR